MKEAISLLLALVMCLSLCACGNSNSNATNPPETQAPINEEPADETQAPANEEPEPPAKDTIYKLGDVMNAFRLCLVGEGKGPGMFDISAFLGKEETLKRIDAAIESLPSGEK